MVKIKLNEVVAERYHLKKGTPPRFAHWKVGDVDVSTLTMPQADELFNAGCEYLVKRETAKAKTITK